MDELGLYKRDGDKVSFHILTFGKRKSPFGRLIVQLDWRTSPMHKSDFPVHQADAFGQDLKSKLKSYHIMSFFGWETGSMSLSSEVLG
jgi:hypothetical protein